MREVQVHKSRMDATFARAVYPRARRVRRRMRRVKSWWAHTGEKFEKLLGTFWRDRSDY